MYWTCLPAAVIWVVVERARGRHEDATARDELAYLIALPRFFFPVLQPFGIRAFVEARQRQSLRLALSALGLVLYGLLLIYLGSLLHPRIRSRHEELLYAFQVRRVLENWGLIYCTNAAALFCAVSLFRLLGYDLGSGFRFPALATSLTDLFRRWNYYYYEYVVSVFYGPLVGYLRRRMPLALAYVLAGYPAILLGVWVPSYVLSYLVGASSFDPVLRSLGSWERLLGYAAFWSLMILPQVVVPRFGRLRKYRWWAVVTNALTLATVFFTLLALYYFRVNVY
jgi:hypothetical protein